MRPSNSILVALETNRDSSGALARAVMLARRYGAPVELFLCEAERAYALHHQYDPGNTQVIQDAFLNESRAALQRQWRSLAVDDVKVFTDAACESPLYDAIRRKSEEIRPLLVIRGIGAGECEFGIADSDIVRTCPAPLLLTRGKKWRAEPTIAAAIDISGVESPALTRSILLAAEDMAKHTGARLEVLYARREGGETLEQSRARLDACIAEARISASQSHVLTGEPATAIPQFAASQGYEMLVLGALTHRKALTALVGSLTGRLVETLDCDMLLVKQTAIASPVAAKCDEEAVGRQRLSSL